MALSESKMRRMGLILQQVLVSHCSTAIMLINKIVDRGQGGGIDSLPDGQSMVEMMIPGNKVGLVIGKGGETIKQLQERAGVKMVMIQDTNNPTAIEKPLRISGEPMRCQVRLLGKLISFGSFNN